jgi:hypothetical protein
MRMSLFRECCAAVSGQDTCLLPSYPTAVPSFHNLQGTLVSSRNCRHDPDDKPQCAVPSEVVGCATCLEPRTDLHCIVPFDRLPVLRTQGFQSGRLNLVLGQVMSHLQLGFAFSRSSHILTLLALEDCVPSRGHRDGVTRIRFSAS